MAYFRKCNPGSPAGLPGLAAPAGLTRSGLPVGIEFDGPAVSDTRLLTVGAVAALPPHPDVHVGLVADSGLIDILSERHNAGVCLGEQVARDIAAVRVGPDLSIAVVGTPGHLAAHGAPAAPHDLTEHRCINLRMPTAGGLYP